MRRDGVLELGGHDNKDRLGGRYHILKVFISVVQI